jgi:putative NADH-flavin reductase
VNITVLGANGKTGIEIVNQALAAGHSVTGLVRNSSTLQAQKNLTIIAGDATNEQDIAKASIGADVIISALGAMGGSLMTDAVTAVIAAGKSTGVSRFILMSSFAVRKDQLSSITRFITGLVMKKAVSDKSMSESLLRRSDLHWTIVYPTALTNSAKGAQVRVVDDTETLSMKHKIARADVAAWILREAEQNAFVNRDVTITS